MHLCDSIILILGQSKNPCMTWMQDFRPEIRSPFAIKTLCVIQSCGSALAKNPICSVWKPYKSYADVAFDY